MVTPRMHVSMLERAEYTDAIALFDNEFILSRRRTVSFAQRYDDVFSNVDCFIAAGKIAGQLVSALVVRPFTWLDNGREWRGAMLGLVCTATRFRNKGYAAEVLAVAEQQCRDLGCDFAVLWASNHQLYESSGWIAEDRGTVGAGHTLIHDSLPVAETAGESTIPAIHALHEIRGTPRIRRTLANYHRILPPAEDLLFFVEGHLFAVCARHKRTGYLYDLVGSDTHMQSFWQKLAGHFDDIYANVEHDSAAYRWLFNHARLEWKPQRLAMWKPLCSARVPFPQWYIPFMDRI